MEAMQTISVWYDSSEQCVSLIPKAKWKQDENKTNCTN